MAKLRQEDKVLLFWILLLTPFLLWALIPHVDVFPMKDKVARVRTGMRALAIALERYERDNHDYPPWGIGATSSNGMPTLNYQIITSFRHERGITDMDTSSVWYKKSFHPLDLPCFAMCRPDRSQTIGTLTTPVAYINEWPRDPFAAVKGVTFVYWAVVSGQPDPSGKIVEARTGKQVSGWILVSPGPDLDYDIAGHWNAYDPSTRQPSPALLALTYDPTNGAVSDGDIWRVKQ